MSDYLDQIAKETNKESLIKIMEEDRPGAARVLAASKNAVPEVLARLAIHSSEMVRVLVARNLKTPTDVLKAMTLDTNVAIRDSARFSLARLGKPKIEAPQSTLPKERDVEEVVKEIKKTDKKPKKNKRKGKKK